MFDRLINAAKDKGSQFHMGGRWMIQGIFALAGFVVMLGIMVAIGINQPRGSSMRTWCFGYLAISVVFDILVVFGLLFQVGWLTELLLGLSAGAATGLAIHVAHHINEFGEEGEHAEGDKAKGIFGF